MKPCRKINIPAYFSSKHVPILALIVTAVLAAAVGLLGGLYLSAETVAGHIKPALRLKIVVRDNKPPPSQHTVLSSQVWPRTEWGQNCSVAGRPASAGLGLLCRLPAIWKDCSGGIYLDVVSGATSQAAHTLNRGLCCLYHTGLVSVGPASQCTPACGLSRSVFVLWGSL
jgi:hypothetical protein